ncbi:hypothetical protein Tco_0566680 [Tanacetum coccineum]
MKLYMMNRQHGRMILESVENGPLIWPMIEKNGVTRPNKYYESSATEAIQADCDINATNIILQGLPPEIYALVSFIKVDKNLGIINFSCKELYDENRNGEFNQQPKFPQLDSGLIVLVFQKGDDPIDAINHMVSFLTAVVTSAILLPITSLGIRQTLGNKLSLIMGK